MIVVGWGGRVHDSVLEHHVHSPNAQGRVDASHELGGRDVRPAGRGAWRTRGDRVRPSWRGRVQWARVLTGRCFLMGGGWDGGPPVEGQVDQ